MRLSGLKLKFLTWLCPNLLLELDRLRWLSEANHDLHMVPVPYTEATVEMAYQNARALEPDFLAGKITIQDRQASLIEVYRRSQ